MGRNTMLMKFKTPKMFLIFLPGRRWSLLLPIFVVVYYAPQQLELKCLLLCMMQVVWQSFECASHKHSQKQAVPPHLQDRPTHCSAQTHKPVRVTQGMPACLCTGAWPCTRSSATRLCAGTGSPIRTVGDS